MSFNWLLPLERRVCNYRGALTSKGKSRTCRPPKHGIFFFFCSAFQPSFYRHNNSYQSSFSYSAFTSVPSSIHDLKLANLQLLLPLQLRRMRAITLILVALVSLAFTESTTSTLTTPSARIVTDNPLAAHYIATFPQGGSQNVVGLCAAETPTNTTTGTLFTFNVNGAFQSGGYFCMSFITI